MHLQAKQEIDFFESSFKPYGLSCMSDPNFLKNVITFGQLGKDKISEETIEFLLPYMELEHFNSQVHTVHKAASSGCQFVFLERARSEQMIIISCQAKVMPLAVLRHRLRF